jgi:hypothetical protein
LVASRGARPGCVGSLVQYPGKIGSLSRIGNMRRNLISATRALRSEPLPNKDEFVSRVSIALVARAARERQCIRPVLKLLLQAHVSGSIERKGRDPDNRDQDCVT